MTEREMRQLITDGGELKLFSAAPLAQLKDKEDNIIL